MNQSRPYSAWQFTCFRVCFGLFLLWHFAALFPYGTELFSNRGLLADASLNPTFGIFPNPLALWDSPLAVSIALGAAFLASLFFTLGIGRTGMAIVLWFLATAFFHRNNLISNPSLPYIGLILLLSALVPSGEPLSLTKKNRDWRMPKWILPTATLLLAIGYTFSGWTKLSSPSWIDGSALAHILQNPLARPGFFRDALLALPESLLFVATWGALLAELLYLPLTMILRTRPWIWLALLGMHLGLICLIDFADLSLGMVMIHLFTFDPAWLPARAPARSKVRVAFDDDCLMCNRFLTFLANEDATHALRFVPLPRGRARTTMIVTRDAKNLRQSDAVLVLLETLGGHWRALALAGRIVPRPIRDFFYRLAARHRHRFGSSKSCALPSAAVRERLVGSEKNGENSNESPTPAIPSRPGSNHARAGVTLLVLLCLCAFMGCSTTSLHKGRIPFTLMERPPGGNHLSTPQAAYREIARSSPGEDSPAGTGVFRPGDVVAFHMSHREAAQYLRRGTIQKIPYELFSYGHLALVVNDPAGPSSNPKLLQLAMNQAANTDDGLEYVRDKSWILYRPTSPIDEDRLDEFVTVVLEKAGDKKKAYDYTATFGIKNRSITPTEPSEIGEKYTCVTIVQAALHYAGHPTAGVHRGGTLDIVTPAQVIRSRRAPNKSVIGNR